MNIDGRNVSLSVKGMQLNKMTEGMVKAMQKNKPFRLYSNTHKGLFVNPTNLSYFDADNNQLMKCQTHEQLNWVLQCATILYDQIELNHSYLPESKKQILLEM